MTTGFLTFTTVLERLAKMEGVGLGLLSALKLATTVVSDWIVNEHGPTPEQPPPQPEKLEPGLGVAMRFTTCPLLKDS